MSKKISFTLSDDKNASLYKGIADAKLFHDLYSVWNPPAGMRKSAAAFAKYIVLDHLGTALQKILESQREKANEDVEA